MDNHEIARRIAALHVLKAVGVGHDGITIKGYTVFVDGTAVPPLLANRIAALKHMIVAIAGDHEQDAVELLSKNKSHRREVAWLWDHTSGEDVLNLIGNYLSMKEP